MKRFFRQMPLCVAVSVMTLWVTANQAQVLDLVPSDALVVFRIKNLTEVNDKAAALAKQWGLVEMAPQAADPLGALLESGGITKGIDRNADAAIVLTNGDLDGAQPPLLILVPVTDYAAFIGNFADAKKEGELDVFTMTVKGEKDKEATYAMNWGKYAAIAPIKELLAKKPDGFRPTGVAAKELAGKDAVTIVNFLVLGPKLDKLLKDKKETILGEVEKNFTKDEKMAKYAPLIKAVVMQGLAMGEEFLADSTSATLSFNLNKEGIAASILADFKGDSYLGKSFAAIKGTDGPMLAGLPDAKYLFFGGGTTAGDEGAKMMADLLKPIEAQLATSGDELKPIVKMLESVKQMMAANKGQVIGLIAPTGALGASSLIQSVTLTKGDAKVLLAGQQQMLEAQQQLMALIPNQPQTKTVFTPNAKTIDGVSFTQFTTEITGNEGTAAQAKQMMTMLYGPAGATGYNAVLDDQHLLTVLGLDDAMIGMAIKAAKENNDSLSKQPNVQMVTRNLPATRLGVFYFDLGQFVTTGTNYAKMMGMPIPVNIKPDLAPIGIAIGTDGPAVREDIFIPADLVEAMVTTTIQLKMMGGGQGKPGGL